MIFNEHLNLIGRHAFLSASSYHWINYDDEKIDRTYVSALAARRGTDIHAFAHEAIRLGIKMGKVKTTLNQYVNDAIGYKMAPEQVLRFSDNCFGTPDAISFRKNLLRIHDLKTGVTQTKETQLEIYAAMFCLEYGVKPHTIKIELRIYQNDEVRVYDGDPDVIVHFMDRIISADKRVNEIKKEALL